jgi:ubiquinone/menaquinone biosynthesis C-methylase UbiE
MDARTTAFEGTTGRLAGAIMARLNRDMEQAAVDELAPGPDDAVLAVGFGPGVGITALVARLPEGMVAGIDPSATMVARAQRHNRAAVDEGRVVLARAGAEAIPWPDGTFTGVVAVNSMQLWEPLAHSLREVSRVLAPGGTLVTVTHTWAMEKRAPLRQGTSATVSILEHCGLTEIATRTAGFRSGPGLVLRARAPAPQPNGTLKRPITG